ncbi:MAG TPA: hypothetical protein VFC74_02385, partial [Oscillospiraceae bacterium]|nr:hypothetical protein [Oscillospiraceae bacterium]
MAETTVTDEAALRAAVTAADAGDIITIGADITLTSPLTLLPVVARAEVLPLDRSEETADSGLSVDTDEDMDTDADANVGAQRLPPTSDMIPMSINPEHAYVVDENSYATLGEALNAVPSGGTGTIELRATVIHNSPVEISNKNITFELTQGSLTIDVSSGTALTVSLGSVVTLTGSGTLDVKGPAGGVYAEGATVTVDNALATSGTGAYARDGGVITVLGNTTGSSPGAFAFGSGSIITVEGDAKTTGSGANAVFAMSGGRVEAKNAIATGTNSNGVQASAGTVLISENVRGNNYGAWAEEKGVITIGGDVTADGTNSIGAWAYTGGTITIDGTITAINYIRIGSSIKTADQITTPTTLTGYYTYTDGTSTVWVQDTGLLDPEDVCKIGTVGYPTLEAALAVVENNETITLLQTIDHFKPIEINGKTITFDLGSFDLNIDTSGTAASYALTAKNGGKVICTGSGKMNVKGLKYGVRVEGGSEIHVSGNVIAGQYGISTVSSGSGNPKITVDGDVTATGQGVDADGEIEAIGAGGYATVEIGGNVTANRISYNQIVQAVYANGSTITVGKNVITQGSGINVQNNGNVTINGSLDFNPTGTGSQWYIKLGYPVVIKTSDDYEDTSTKPGYKEYKNGDNIVWIKGAIQTTYAVTVIGGTGSGNYAENATVNITAGTAPEGKEFDKWTTTDGVTFANANSQSTSFTMPDKAVTVTATYKDLAPSYYSVVVQ